MSKRLKEVLVESYVGAIALGWIFASASTQFTNAFVVPLNSWIVRREYPGFAGNIAARTGFSFQDALPELLGAILLLLIGYVLLRWLYFAPVEKQTP